MEKRKTRWWKVDELKCFKIGQRVPVKQALFACSNIADFASAPNANLRREGQLKAVAKEANGARTFLSAAVLQKQRCDDFLGAHGSRWLVRTGMSDRNVRAQMLLQ
jgi:hypothetical protein